MNINIWSDILNSMTDEELCQMANSCSINVPGFRKISKDTIKMCKPRLLKEAVMPQNFNKIIDYFNKKFSLVNGKDNYRSMNIDQLILSAQHGTPHYKILTSLYSSQEENLIDLANEFIKKVSKENQLNDNKKKDASYEGILHKESQEQIQLLRELVKKLENKLVQIEEKKNNIQLELNKLKDEFQNAKVSWNLEKTRLSKKIEKLQNEIEEKETEISTVQTEKERISKYYEEQLQKKEMEIDFLNKKILNNKETNIRQIALIGNPKNKTITNNSRVPLVIFEASDIEESINNNDFEQFNEIWVLSYKVPFSKQKLISEKIKGKIKTISTFLELQKMVEKG